MDLGTDHEKCFSCNVNCLLDICKAFWKILYIHLKLQYIELHFHWSMVELYRDWWNNVNYLVLYKFWTWISYLRFKLIPPLIRYVYQGTQRRQVVQKTKLFDVLKAWTYFIDIGLLIYSLSVIYNFLRRELSRQGMYIQHKFSEVMFSDFSKVT